MSYALNSGNSGLVWVNGAIQSYPTSYYIVNGTTLRFTAAPANGASILLVYLSLPLNSTNSYNLPRDSFTGNGSSTTYTLSSSVSTSNGIIVFVGGVPQTVNTSYYVTNGTTLNFTTAPVNGAAITVIYLGVPLSIGTPADGSVGTTQLGINAVTNANIASSAVGFTNIDSNTQALFGSSFKNKIIGGDFGTNPWQRGTSTTTIATGVYTADRFRYNKSGTMVHTVQKTADAPTVAQSGVYTDSCVELVCTTAQAIIGSTDFCNYIQIIEGYNFRAIAQQAFTFSFWVKAYKAGTYCIGFNNSVSDRCYAAEYTIAQSGVWQKVVIHVPASPSAGTWNYTTGNGLTVSWNLAAGSNSYTTAGSWVSTATNATANQTNGVDSTNNYFRIALVQVEAGSQATAFEGRSVQQELALCQRYYEVLGADTAAIYVRGYNNTGVSIAQSLSYAVAKRAAPTTTKVGTWTVSNAGQPVLQGHSVSVCSVVIAIISTGDGYAYTADATTYIKAESEI